MKNKYPSFEERFNEADKPSKFWAAMGVIAFFTAFYLLTKYFVK